jgi:hypothetical protein
VLADPSNLFLFRRIQLLKSVDDGLDLERNAAEYMMALANLNVKPNDPLTLVCKSMAMKVLLFKNEGYKDTSTDITEQEEAHTFAKPMAPVAVGIEGASSEPSRHPWVDPVRLTTIDTHLEKKHIHYCEKMLLQKEEDLSNI